MQYLDDYLQDKKCSGPGGGGETVNSPTAVDFAGIHELDDEEDEWLTACVVMATRWYVQ